MREEDLFQAARQGDLEALKAIVPHIPCDVRGVTTVAAAHGHYDCMRYLHSQGFPMDFALTTLAYLNNQRKCYDWGIKKGLPEPQFFTQKKEINKTITVTQVEKEWDE